PDARRHRIHLGASRAPVPAPCARRRAAARHARRLSRALRPTAGGPGMTAPINDEALLAEVRAWLAAHWNRASMEAPCSVPRSPERRAFLEKVLAAGWAVPTWPREWHGRGLTAEQGRLVERAFAEVGAPGAGQDRINLW